MMPPELQAHDVAKLVATDCPTMLEIGCNDGMDTLKFLKAMPHVRLFCFEPDPRAAKRFRENVSDWVPLEEAAISSEDGIAVFYGSSGRAPERSRRPGAPACCWLDEWDLSGSLRKPTGHLSFSPWTTFPEDRQYEVKTLRLDTWLARSLGVECIDFIWCDVQGAEADVIQGAANALARTRYFYTEYYDTPMYEGQPNLDTLRGMLPTFDLLGIYGPKNNPNALFQNKAL
jgi:FkbM family methyltransferase